MYSLTHHSTEKILNNMKLCWWWEFCYQSTEYYNCEASSPSSLWSRSA